MRFVIFLITFIGCMVLCTIGWQMVFPGRIYHCVDEVGLDYLSPGDWIHGQARVVDRIDPTGDLSQPDSIKAGWSTPRLWFVWISLFCSTLLISLWTASRFPNRKPPPVGN